MSSALNLERIFVNHDISDKNHALRFLSEKAFELEISNNSESIFNSFIERESIISTGMLDGFAIPHAVDSSISELGVLILRTTHEIEWQSLDDQSIVFIISLLVPEKQSEKHLEMLTNISKVLMNDKGRKILKEQLSVEGIYNSYVLLERGMDNE